MPTTRTRHFVTESDEVAQALDAAALRWPGLSRAQLIVRLILEAHATAEQSRNERIQRRRAAIRASAGALSGVYGPDYLERLREDWPE